MEISARADFSNEHKRAYRGSPRSPFWTGVVSPASREGGGEGARPLNRALKYLYAREYKSNRFIKGPGVDGGARGAAATAGFSGAWSGKQDDGRGTAILRLVGKKGRKREREEGEERGREATRYTSPLSLFSRLAALLISSRQLALSPLC